MEIKTDNKVDSAQNKREQILNTAKHVFAKYGYRGTRVDDIAEQLGVGKGTIYRYFKDKKTLFVDVFETGMYHLNHMFKKNVETIEVPPKRIKAAITLFLKHFDGNREMIEIMMQMRSEFKDEYKRISNALYADYIVRIQENLQNGINQGLFRQMDVEKTAEAMSSMLHGILQTFYYVKETNESLTDRADAMVGLVLNGLMKTQEENEQ